MTKPLKSRKTKRSFEINWKIREIFSEAALASFCDEIDTKYKYLEIEKKDYVLILVRCSQTQVCTISNFKII